MEDSIEIIVTDGKEEYLKKLEEKEAVNKRKSDRCTIMSTVTFILGSMLVLLILNNNNDHVGICLFSGLFCLLLAVIFSKLDDKPRAIYYDAQDRRRRVSDFLEKYEKNQLLNIGYCYYSSLEYLVYDYEEKGKVKSSRVYIDKYEYRTDIDKSILILGDEIILKRKYFTEND